jgi:hypothetical protein
MKEPYSYSKVTKGVMYMCYNVGPNTCIIFRYVTYVSSSLCMLLSDDGSFIGEPKRAA